MLPELIVSTDTLLSMVQLQAYAEAEVQRQKDVVLARAFHLGEQQTQISVRMKQFLQPSDDFPEFRLNVTANIVKAIMERLIVNGFDAPEDEVIEWSWEWWKRNKLDALQTELYEAVFRDGEYFIIVDFDEAAGASRATLHQRYTSLDYDGDGYGCWMAYQDDDYNQKALYAVKLWYDAELNAERRNIYYPQTVIKQKRANNIANWETIESVDWTDSDGNPLGIAVVHFKNHGLRCEAWDAFPLQMAINKSLIDLMLNSDMSAFRIYKALGFVPTTDGGPLKSDRSNLLQIEPGTVVGTTKSASDSDFDAIAGEELNPQMDLTHQLILWLATVTNTPVSRFISTKLIASDETLKEQEAPLLSRVTSAQIMLGNAWEDCLRLASKLETVYSSESVPEIDEIETMWDVPYSRGQVERLELQLKKQQLGIPRRQLWREMGYNNKQIEKMEMDLQEQEDAERDDGRREEGSSEEDS